MSTTQLSVNPNIDLLTFADALTSSETPLRFTSSTWEVQNATSQNNGFSQGFGFNIKGVNQAVYWPSAFLAIPWVIAGTSRVNRPVVDPVVDTSTLGNPYFVGFKAPGSLSIIDRVVLKVGGATVSDANNGLSRYMWLKFLMTVSENWYRQNGSALYMGTELPEAEVLSMRSNMATASTNINIWSNVTITPAEDGSTAVVPADGPVSNAGNVYNANRSFMSRCFNISRPGCRNMSSPSASANTNRAQNARSPFILPTPLINNTVADGSVYLSGYAMVPLVWVHDIFRELKVAQNVSINMTIFVNSCYSVLPADGGASMADNSEAKFFQEENSCPIMVSTAGCTSASGNVLGRIRGQGNVGAIGIAFGSHGLNVGDGIQNVSATRQQLVSNSYASVELWYQVLQLTPAQAGELTANPPKSLLFSDFALGNAMTTTIAPNASFDYNVGEKTSPRRLIFTLHTPRTLMTNNVPVHQGCISSAGYFSDPGLAIRNLQVKVDGAPVFVQTIDYDYLHYQSSFKPNLGGASCNSNVSYAQGIYSKQAWDVSPIYVVNVDTFAPAGKAPTLIISGVNASSTPIIISCYIEILKQMDVKVSPSQFQVISSAESI